MKAQMKAGGSILWNITLRLVAIVPNAKQQHCQYKHTIGGFSGRIMAAAKMFGAAPGSESVILIRIAKAGNSLVRCQISSSGIFGCRLSKVLSFWCERLKRVITTRGCRIIPHEACPHISIVS